MNTPRRMHPGLEGVLAAGAHRCDCHRALHAAEPVYFDVARGSHPHDVAAAPAPGGPVYYTAQTSGKLGILDPKSGKYEEIPLGRNSAPHGVIVGPDGAPWITDGGQNAIVRVDPATRAVRVWPLPADVDYANLNTLTFDAKGRVWFTGQSGYYGRLVPATGDMKVWKAPRGNGPYGITTTPRGDVYYASLAQQSHRAHRHRVGRSDRDRAADAAPGRATRVVRFARADLGQLLEHGPGRHVRPGHEGVARMEAAGRLTACVFGVGR